MRLRRRGPLHRVSGLPHRSPLRGLTTRLPPSPRRPTPVPAGTRTRLSAGRCAGGTARDGRTTSLVKGSPGTTRYEPTLGCPILEPGIGQEEVVRSRATDRRCPFEGDCPSAIRSIASRMVGGSPSVSGGRQATPDGVHLEIVSSDVHDQLERRLHRRVRRRCR
jgi:hypothetical protein